MAEIQCSSCGTINRAGAKFCHTCGAVLPSDVPRTVLAGDIPAASESVSGDRPSPPPAASPGVPPYRPPPKSPPVTPYQPISPPKKSASRSWLGMGANLAAVILGFIFVFLVSEALPVLNVSSDLLDGEKYKASLREQDVYNRFPDLFAEQMQRSQASLEKEARLDLSGVTAADWKLIATQLVTPQWMQSQVESLIDQTFNAAKEDAAAPKLELNLAEVTQRLGGDAGLTSINRSSPASAAAAWMISSISSTG